MDTGKYEYQSEFARRYVAEGEAKGKAELLMKLLSRRFGALPDEVIARVRAATSQEIDVFAERLLTAEALDEVFGF